MNFERAKKIIREAAEQCGRAKLPELSEISDFEKAAEFRAREGGLNFILDVDAGISLKKIVHEKKPSGEINIFVGPEGGFSEDEIAAAEKAGFQIISLGKRILRAETAAIAACALLVD